jgi:hypothetical protein
MPENCIKSDIVKTIFKSASLTEEFLTNGYVVLPFLSENELSELSALFDKYKPRFGDYSIYSNLEDNDLEINLYIEHKIRELFTRSVEKYFCDYKIFGGSYLVKGLGENSDTQLHQDWNAVDENKDISLSIWVPLADVNESNGCLQVIPGSHRWFSTIRSANFPSLYVKVDPELECKTVSIPVKAGTAVVFALNLFHGSKPNKTGDIRKAVHLALVNNDAQIIHYVRATEENTIFKVMCDKDFLYKELFNILKGNIPEHLKILESIPNSHSLRVNEDAFFQKLNIAN